MLLRNYLFALMNAVRTLIILTSKRIIKSSATYSLQINYETHRMTGSFSLTPGPLSTNTRTGLESREPRERMLGFFFVSLEARTQTWHVYK